MKDPLAVLNAIHQVIISAGAPSVDENIWVQFTVVDEEIMGKPWKTFIVSQSPAYSRYISYIIYIRYV